MRKNRDLRVVFTLMTVLLLATTLRAELTVPSFFSDHMVLQRGESAQLWGTADAEAEVTIAFRGQRVSTQADAQGNWHLSVPTGEADASGSALVIQAGDEKIHIKDVLVGEVWFASGQSNMVFTMNRVPAYADVLKTADHPQIRMFNAPLVTARTPQDTIDGAWTVCSPETAPGYSAVAFFFARKLQRELDIPVGVIKSAWGGKPVETFTSRQALKTLEGTRRLVASMEEADAKYDPAQAQQRYQTRLEQWTVANAAWRKKPADQRGRRPRRPAAPKPPMETEGQPGVLFNSMIHPFIGYTIRGAIWYQGEGNAKPGAVPYDQTLPLMITDWRRRWDDDFSFYFVQLANFREPTDQPGSTDPWPLLQDRMRRVLDTTPGTGMAIINDIGEAKDIHPKNKHDVGERLALWALAKDYGRDIVHCGPLYRSSEVKDGVVHVKFEHVGEGLRTRDGGPVQRFEVAGEDGVWRWAEAEITGPATVAVRCAEVKQPVAVRYAWAANPAGANLINSAGLPASVFDNR